MSGYINKESFNMSYSPSVCVILILLHVDNYDPLCPNPIPFLYTFKMNCFVSSSSNTQAFEH